MDPKRIAAAGYSAGSFVAALTGAVDTRLRARVPVGGGNLHASRGPALVFNGAADNTVALPTHLKPFFAGLRKRVAELRGSAQGIVETSWEPEAPHRPLFVTKPVALGFERQLDFPNWSEADLRSMAETHVSEWAKAHPVERDPRYAQREGEARALGTGVPGLSREVLSVFRAAGWQKQKSRMTHETWLKEAKERITSWK